jgi:N4-gp56 family major capsid protein
LSYVEILTDNGLTQEQWDNKLFTEYTGELQFKNFMGEGPTAIIQVKEELTKEDGDAITIGMRGRLVGGRISGNSKGVGNEGTLSFFNQRITIDNYRRLVKIENVRMSNKRTGFNVLEQARMALQDESVIDLEEDIIDALTDTASGRVRGRYLYGAADSNWNATHATAEANVDATNDKLTTDAVEVMKRKAVIPVNALTKMRPMKIKGGKAVENWFVFMGHTYNFRDLRKFDAAWVNAHLNIPPQAMSDSPIYTGSWFKGSWEGVLMYEYDRMPLDATAGASSIQVSHNVLLGAQAAAVCWGQRSKFGEEDQDLKHTKIFEVHEIRGIQKLVFDRATPEDNGVVHGFFAAVAD